jgi:hypothetical protein
VKTVTRKVPYTICRFCKKTVRLKPAGGDWLNDIYPVRHDEKPGVRCLGSFSAVRNKDILQDR